MAKKLFCLVLSLLLALSLTATALADDALSLLSLRVSDDGYLAAIVGTEYTSEADLNFTASTEKGDLDISDPTVLRNQGTTWFVVLEYGYYGDSEPLIRTQKRILQRISEMVGDNDQGALVETQVSPTIAIETKAGEFRDRLIENHQKKTDGAKQLGSTIRSTLEYIGNNQDKLKPNVAMIVITSCPSGQVTESMIEDIGKDIEKYGSVSTHIIVTAGGNVHTKDRPLGEHLIKTVEKSVAGTGYLTSQLTPEEGERGVKFIDDIERSKVLMVLDPKNVAAVGQKLTIRQKTSGGKELSLNQDLPQAMYDLWMERVQGRVDDGSTPSAQSEPLTFGPAGGPSTLVLGNSDNIKVGNSGMSTELLIGIIVGAVVLVLLAVLLILRLRKGNSSSPKSAPAVYATNTPSASGSAGTAVTLAGTNGAVLKGQMKNGRLTIGRNGSKAMVSVPNDGKLSGLHATFTKQGAILLITDNGSTNGTKVNGNKIAANVPTALQQNDTVTLGSTTYTVTWRG